MKKIISIIILSIFLIACGNQGNTGNDGKDIINGVAISKKNIQMTPMGSTVYGLNPTTPEFISQVDSGLTMAFNNARLSGWSKNMEHSRYTVYSPYEPCIPSPQQGIMSFKVRTGGAGGGYDGTIYDYDGREPETDLVRLATGYPFKANDRVLLYAAEMVVEMNQDYMTMIVCPGPDAINANNNGAEHYLAAMNDPAYYALTETHTIIPHPILPVRNSAGKGKAQEIDKLSKTVKIGNGFAKLVQ